MLYLEVRLFISYTSNFIIYTLNYVNIYLEGSDMTLDDRSFVMQAVTIMDIPTSVVYFYPRLIPLHEIQVDSENAEVPDAVRTTVEKMTDNGVYLLGRCRNHSSYK